MPSLTLGRDFEDRNVHILIDPRKRLLGQENVPDVRSWWNFINKKFLKPIVEYLWQINSYISKELKGVKYNEAQSILYFNTFIIK